MKRNERLHPEEMIQDDFEKYLVSGNMPSPVQGTTYRGVSMAFIKAIYKQAWWDGRASQFNLRPKETANAD